MKAEAEEKSETLRIGAISKQDRENVPRLRFKLCVSVDNAEDFIHVATESFARAILGLTVKAGAGAASG